jgi:hypothetical protein
MLSRPCATTVRIWLVAISERRVSLNKGAGDAHLELQSTASNEVKGGKRQRENNRSESQQTVSRKTILVNPITAKLGILKRMEGGVVTPATVSPSSLEMLVGAGILSRAGAELTARVLELEAEGKCEPGLTAANVLMSCITCEKLRQGKVLPKHAAEDQLRLGMPRSGAESKLAAKFIREGKNPWRLVIEFMIGTAGSEAGIGATWFRGYGERMEIKHVGDNDFPLSSRMQDIYNFLTGFKDENDEDVIHSKEAKQVFQARVPGDVEFEDPKELGEIITKLNLEFTDFVGICIRRYIQDLCKLPGFTTRPQDCGEESINFDDVSMVAGLPLTIFYTTKPHAYKLDTPWGKEIGSAYCITDFIVPERVAALVGLPVFCRARQSDMAVGNSGAPLANGQDERELPPALRRRGLTRGIHINGGGQTNAHGMNLKSGRSAGDDLGIGAAALNKATRLLTNFPMDKGGYLASRGAVIPDLLERMLNYHCMLVRDGKKSGREDWKKILPMLLKEYAADYSPEDEILTVSVAVAKFAVFSIKKRIVPAIGAPQYCLLSGGLWNHPQTRRAFEEEMRAEFGTQEFETYPELHPGTAMGTKELILCGVLAQEGSAGNIFHSVATGNNKTILGTLF